MAIRFIIAIFLIISVLGKISSACRVSPEFWCENHEIAKDCAVEKQCETFTKSNAKPVNVAVYYETLCPGSINFITTQLTPTFRKIGSIMNISLVPFGNTKMYLNTYLPGGHWFRCQHGGEECIGNMIETCAIYYHSDQSIHLPFINYIASSPSLPTVAAVEYAREHKLNYTKINAECVNSYYEYGLGVRLEAWMRTKTYNHPPFHTYTPWVTINGVHTTAIQNKARTDLLGLVCSTYTGSPKPKACTESLPI